MHHRANIRGLEFISWMGWTYQKPGLSFVSRFQQVALVFAATPG